MLLSGPALISPPTSLWMTRVGARQGEVGLQTASVVIEFQTVINLDRKLSLRCVYVCVSKKIRDVPRN